MAEEVQAETQTALNPHEAVAYLAEAMETAEQETVRDEKGKFAKPVNEEPEAAAEETEEPQEETEATESQEEAPRKIKLKYKGEDQEMLEPEVIELAQKGYDYTQKTQALAQERAELSAKVKAEAETARRQFESQLQTYEQLVLKLADQEALTADLAAVAQQDPAKALQLSLKRSQIAETINAVRAEQQKLTQQRQAELQETVQKQAREAVEKLKERVPGWSNDLYTKILKGSETTYGYSSNELNAITDHRAIEVLHDALKWKEYQAARPKTADKRVQSVPKVQKPGSAEKPSAKAQGMQDSLARLNKTGSRQDAQDYVLQLMSAGRL